MLPDTWPKPGPDRWQCPSASMPADVLTRGTGRRRDPLLRVADALEQDLRATLSGEVRFDKASRALYSTDASVYQIEPRGVVIPRSRDDVEAAVTIAARHGVSITPRGGGTSQAGQSIGDGLVLDTSKYLNRVLGDRSRRAHRPRRARRGPRRTEPPAQAARPALRPRRQLVEPRHRGRHDGQQLERRPLGALRQDHRPRPLRSRWCSPTARRRRWPRSRRRRSPRPRAATRFWRGRCATCRPWLAPHAGEIDRRFPKVLRRVGGYNLDAFVDPAVPVDLSRLMVGSEGTLGFITEATVGLVPLPAVKALVTLEFDDLLDALAATPRVLTHRPSAVEVMDDFILSHARGHATLDAALRADRARRPSRRSCAWSSTTTTSTRWCRGWRLASATSPAPSPGCRARRLLDAVAQARVWHLRESALGLSMAMKGDAKAISFVEDTAVAPERLRDYIARFQQLVARHGTVAGVYAHASVGCLHVRPVVNLKTAERRGAVRGHRPRRRRPGARVRRRALGRARRRAGARRLQREDVRDDALPGLSHRQAHLRPAGAVQSGPHRRHAADHVAPALRPGLSHAGAAHATSTSAPTAAWAAPWKLAAASAPAARRARARCARRYMATRDEAHSTRGRANVLRLAMTGQLGPHGLDDPGAARSARPVPRVPRLQERVPDERGHGPHQERGAGRSVASATARRPR